MRWKPHGHLAILHGKNGGDPNMNPDPKFWAGKRVLLTGHTGFKGWWLACWLNALGAKVTGLSIGPLEGESLYKGGGSQVFEREIFIDIRDEKSTRKAVESANPEVLFHLAAQSLVRLSYDNPVETFSTNFMGTVHILNAARQLEMCRSIVCVTSDKCYENREWHWAYRENEAMGGHDPYSASKGAAELAIASLRRSFFGAGKAGVGSARAGNVIGGGDWAADRLVPDCLKAFGEETSVEIRNPAATRPWQHVLEPLNGYLLLGEKLFAANGKFDEGWNFGPPNEGVKPVETIVETMVELWGENASWHLAKGAQPHEAISLNVDASKAKHRLGWSTRLPLTSALEWTIDWHKRYRDGEAPGKLCLEQINCYQALTAGM